MVDDEQIGDPVGVFTTTRWDLIRLAVNVDADEQARRQAARALNELCGIYRASIVAYLERHPRSHQDAEDIAQQFCAERISPALLANANASKGRFRSLLLIALKNFLHDRSKHRNTQKRGGEFQFVPYDEAAIAAPSDPRAADLRFDVAWATTVVQRALEHLKQHYADRRDRASYQQLLPFLGSVADHARLSDLARVLDLSANAIAVRISRFRALYARFIRQELARTVRTPDEIEPETRYLLEVLAVAGNQPTAAARRALD